MNKYMKSYIGGVLGIIGLLFLTAGSPLDNPPPAGFVLRNTTTDAAQTELFADGSVGDVSVLSDCTLSFRINVVARRTDADNESAAYFFEGAIDNNAGTTALVGTIGKTILAEDTAAWDATVTADDTNDGINVLVTGEAAKTISWVARAEITEVCG